MLIDQLSQKCIPFTEPPERGEQTDRKAEDEKIYEEMRVMRGTRLDCLSIYLEKRNRKFTKPLGNKLLVKYDGQNVAKEMLEGTPKSRRSVNPERSQDLLSCQPSTVSIRN
jgi:hypothetical protein